MTHKNAMQAAQHDILAAETADACSTCITHKMSYLKTADDLDIVPLTAPESGALTQFSVRCGVHGKFPMGLAVSQVSFQNPTPYLRISQSCFVLLFIIVLQV